MPPPPAEDQIQLFHERLGQLYPGCEIGKSEGASNSPTLVPIEPHARGECYKIGQWNLDGVAAGGTRICRSVLYLPEQTVLNLALVFQDAALAGLVNTVNALRQSLATPGPPPTPGQADKVNLYLANGEVYAQQGGKANILDLASGRAFGPVRPTAFVYSDSHRDGDLEPVAREHVRYFRRLVAGVPLIRITSTGAATEAGPIDINAKATLDRILHQVPTHGNFDPDLILRYHLALTHHPRKHFVILSGISGTGKTSLARGYAAAVLNVPAPSEADGFYLIAVHPDWTEPDHLLGYVDTIQNEFVSEPFTAALLRAYDNPQRPVFVCLDEMNLAQPEYYFADALSAMELPQGSIRLHSQPERVAARHAVPWPTNLYITGTVNMDETTRPFSPKVLDRAQVIDLSDTVQIAAYREGGKLAERFAPLPAPRREKVLDLLDGLYNALRPVNLHSGYRSLNEIGEYLRRFNEVVVGGDRLPNVPEDTLWRDAIDIQVEQKLLTKVRGGDTDAEQVLLKSLTTLLKDYPRCRAVIERMKQDQEAHGSFQYWR